MKSFHPFPLRGLLDGVGKQWQLPSGALAQVKSTQLESTQCNPNQLFSLPNSESFHALRVGGNWNSCVFTQVCFIPKANTTGRLKVVVVVVAAQTKDPSEVRKLRYESLWRV